MSLLSIVVPIFNEEDNVGPLVDEISKAVEPLGIPFEVVLVPLNQHKSPRVREVADRLYAELTEAGIEVLYDDRDARPGVKFADAELIGIPHRLVVGERGLDAGKLEYRGRRDAESTEFPADNAVEFIRSRMAR